MKLANRERKTLNKRAEKFIQLGKEKYGEDTYNYSRVPDEYINNRTPVHISCNRCKGEPFLVYPMSHTSKGDNQEGTCTHCYVPKKTVQKTRWDPNRPQRIAVFRETLEKKYGKGRYTYPYLEEEYKNENSDITVECNGGCNSKPYKRKARALKSKSRKGGCKICNKKAMAKIIAEKNKKRLLRNHQTQDLPREYGCIYMISNTKNGKIYIGYTTMSAKQRLKAHLDEAVKLSKGNKKAKSYLHSAMNYHGHKYFTVGILQEHKDVTPIKLGELERNYIARMKPEYNVSPGGEIGHYKTHSKIA